MKKIIIITLAIILALVAIFGICFLLEKCGYTEGEPQQKINLVFSVQDREILNWTRKFIERYRNDLEALARK